MSASNTSPGQNTINQQERGKNSLVPCIQAGVAYAFTVFAIGFLLGAVRILLIAPRTGPIAAVSVELPIMLAASWYVSSRYMRHSHVDTGIRARLLVGCIAFVTLMILEIALAIGLFHRSMGVYLAELQSAAGMIGLTGQVGFATLPLVEGMLTRRRGESPQR